MARTPLGGCRRCGDVTLLRQGYCRSCYCPRGDEYQGTNATHRFRIELGRGVRRCAWCGYEVDFDVEKEILAPARERRARLAERERPVRRRKLRAKPR